MDINVLKANGESELFSEKKLRESIHRAGINGDLEEDVVTQVKSGLYEGIPTSQIYATIMDYMNQKRPFAAERYNLKKAIMDLGPTGYPFEDFIAELLKKEGYKVEVGVILEGKCVKHEIDVLAEKEGKKIMIEAKFHNSPGVKTDVHVPLYQKSRFEDLKEKHNIDEAWIITNTKMTLDAIVYSQCIGINLISWNHPQEGSLRDLIEKWSIHPITQLSSLTIGQKQQLLENHCILCRNVNMDSLKILGIPENQEREIIKEAEYISNTHS